MRHLFTAFATVVALLFSLPASASDVILTIRDGEREQDFSLAQLRALDAREVNTTTIWSEGVQNFVGVSLDRLMDHVGVTEGTLEVAAVNDYAVEIPMSDVAAGGPIVAYMRNGKTMSLRDKGPLWIIYPYDSGAEFRTEAIYSRSIWQLNRITVR
ncbi:molybdopterin-dependent oxidoreductase [Tritonibacter horizontis]|uniref:Oxidoreductase molybdopterin binding domain protein n=1 Tax=Tritonibacter horizontis TaxID=1768241 RepID=A0A132BWC2_9RHOB|nr:molybdopterin-dependent oxidoreductase [Tritonibacter horizontis]KUP92683.1 oxidoreductase molybdopterin binding domain protein [Tritonibacter horizontis]